MDPVAVPVPMSEQLLAMGLPGIAILALGTAVVMLYRRNQELNTALFDIGREAIKANLASAAALVQLRELLAVPRGKSDV